MAVAQEAAHFSPLGGELELDVAAELWACADAKRMLSAVAIKPALQQMRLDRSAVLPTRADRTDPLSDNMIAKVAWIVHVTPRPISSPGCVGVFAAVYDGEKEGPDTGPIPRPETLSRILGRPGDHGRILRTSFLNETPA